MISATGNIYSKQIQQNGTYKVVSEGTTLIYNVSEKEAISYIEKCVIGDAGYIESLTTQHGTK